MNTEVDITLDRAKNALIAHDYDAAEKLIRSKLVSDPENTKLLAMLGTIYLRGQKITNALEIYKRVLKLDPENIDAMNNLGVIYRHLKKYKESIDVLNTALSKGVHTSEIYYNLGNTS